MLYDVGMKLIRIAFVALVVAAITHGSTGMDFPGQETDEEFMDRMCATMGWQREYVDMDLCRMLDEELRRWK